MLERRLTLSPVSLVSLMSVVVSPSLFYSLSLSEKNKKHFSATAQYICVCVCIITLCVCVVFVTAIITYKFFCLFFRSSHTFFSLKKMHFPPRLIKGIGEDTYVRKKSRAHTGTSILPVIQEQCYV